MASTTRIGCFLGAATDQPATNLGLTAAKLTVTNPGFVALRFEVVGPGLVGK